MEIKKRFSETKITVIPMGHNIDTLMDVGKTIIQITPNLDESFYVCNLSEIVNRYHLMGELLPRVRRYYGKDGFTVRLGCKIN